MKKLPTTLSATTLLASADVLRSDVSSFSVNVPNIQSGFEINVEGLLLKPNNFDLDYGCITDDSFSSNSQNILLTVKPDIPVGYGVGIRYAPLTQTTKSVTFGALCEVKPKDLIL